MATLTAALFVVAAPAAHAGQSVDPSTLNPPPPDFETCRTVGNGVTCQGSRPLDPTGAEWTPLVCGTGASAFNIYASSEGQQVALRHYDQNLNLVGRQVHAETFGEASNPLAGTAVPYHSTDEIVDVYATPGDEFSATESHMGSMIFTLPHQGAVEINAGKITFGPTGDIEFASAQNPYAFNTGNDMSQQQGLCDALAG
jgi:hypothetical protein